MNPTLNLRTHILAPKRLEKLMLRDKPVVPPDSVIKTFGNLKGDRIDLVLTQDGEGLCPGSFVLKNGEWAQFFLDTWFDPLYRSYNFQKAEAHALVCFSFPFPLPPPLTSQTPPQPLSNPNATKSTQPTKTNRNTSSNGTPPSSPNSPSSPNAPSTPTTPTSPPAAAPTPSTRTAISSSGSWAATPMPPAAARPNSRPCG